MDDLIKIVKSLEDSGLLLEGVTKSVQNEVKEQKGGFLKALLGTLGESLLGNLLAKKGINRAGEEIERAIVWMFNAASPFNKIWNAKALSKYSKFNGGFSRYNLPNKIKDGAYVTNLDEYSDVGTRWIALWINNDATYFDSFGVEHIPREIKKFIGNKNIIANIFRIRAYDSIICGYFCIGFIKFMLAGKKLTDYTNLFAPHDLKKKWQYNSELF